MNRIIFVLLLFVTSCADPSQVAPSNPTTQVRETTASATPSLTFAWETDSLLTTVESVHYDPVTQHIYTANIDGDFMEKDGQGSISKINLDGDIVALDWISGLDAPTGLSSANGTLYTTDIDRLVEIDLAAGEIRNVFPVPGATALNDVTISPEGIVYTSDTGGNAIYMLENGVIAPLVTDIDTPNGLLYHKSGLLVSQWTPAQLQHLDLTSTSFTKLGDGLEQADGIDVLDNRGYLVSSWGGRVFFVDHEGNTTTLLDTSAEGINASDVHVIADRQLVLVTTFSTHTVTAYRLE